ncbi:hypothetical protein CONPUDRAFT_71560 [Coniophora puteana RWD-64-598 SS2]|uniref:Protein CASP n=1 Tax=Coniophora puteana (strain RWD-64-598) TaxID=741705 RepID=A0A5M3MVY1_CONPW|nr:uncharacterized protein CONPUDRAFT_71560 [Coniophora puteana RWD-64-598 SS2]EIW82884.1 hypothetical protein CONPUDRAFT_71560 [Coniophora puteana RWD-64-598 SS2]
MSTSLDGSSNFSGALATWKSVNLADLQKTLDAQGIEIVDNQKESVVGRKALADRTKEFKKISDEEKLNAFKGLLKFTILTLCSTDAVLSLARPHLLAYQSEIDALTKRSKTAENAFLHVYKVLAEAPDPYPLLEAAVDQTAHLSALPQLEAEVARLKSENAELKKKAADSGPAEAARKRAEARVSTLETKMEEMIHDKVVQKENELNAAYDERMRNYEEREQDLQKHVTLFKNQLRDLRTSNESNQAKLFDQSQRMDQEVVSRLAEADMIMADLERANSRVALVEQRNEALRAEIEAMRSGSETSEHVRSLTAQLESVTESYDRLQASLDTQRASATEVEQDTRRRVDAFTKELTERDREIESLKSKLKTCADYDEVKRELEIMKYVEFAGLNDDPEDSEDGDGDAWGDSMAGTPNGLDGKLALPNPNADKANAQRGRSLEVLLATKNKRMLEELTRFRIIHAELEESLRGAREELTIAQGELEKQRTLNDKLEDDLLKMDAGASKTTNNGDASVRPTPGRASGSADDVLGDLDLGKKSTDSGARGTTIPFASAADTSILPIVTSQRDRFRQRNAELEEELRKQFSIISELRTDIKSLQGDNLKLYEKVRYMQSYRDDSTTQLDPLGGSSSSTGGRASSSRNGDDMGKWRARYEESMNPFEAFRGREATRAYEALNPIERGVLMLTRAILANRRTRTAFICYAAVLHVLVMFTTYECAFAGPQLQTRPSPYGT